MPKASPLIRTPLLACVIALSACARGPASSAPASSGPAPEGDLEIVATLDLTPVSEVVDRIPVEIDPGRVQGDTVLFRMPRVVQGTYDVSDFGRMVEDLRVWDEDGRPLPVEQLDVDTWRIAGARRLDRVTYFANDTYDQERDPGGMPFSPSGTNIDPDAFVLNLHGMVGYFEGEGEADYEIRIRAPAGLVASSALPMVDSIAEDAVVTRVYRAERYFQVTDNPLFYGDMTVASFQVPDIEVVLSVYSPTGKYEAAQLAPALERGMAAQRAYLGDLVRTDRYDIFLFLSDDGTDQPGGSGALEHHRSTVMVYPEAFPLEALEQALIDVVSHEFFHTVSPLAVHSEDVHFFDYHDPTFSKHLWMYEGQTEYFAQHFQVYEGLVARDRFFERMGEKIVSSWSYDDDMSFTVMSENILDEPWASQYANVYQKGALIGMCLDVLLRSQSGGERSLIGLMGELSRRYGVERPFEDDDIIEEITQMTYPEVGAFLRRHVAGTTPIDYGACLAPAGMLVEGVEVPALNVLILTPGTMGFTANEDGSRIVLDHPVSTFRDMGVMPGDVLISVNGSPITQEGLVQLMEASASPGPEEQLTVVIERDGRELEFSGSLGRPTWLRPTLVPDPDATPAQVAIRNAWLGGA